MLVFQQGRLQEPEDHYDKPTNTWSLHYCSACGDQYHGEWQCTQPMHPQGYKDGRHQASVMRGNIQQYIRTLYRHFVYGHPFIKCNHRKDKHETVNNTAGANNKLIGVGKCGSSNNKVHGFTSEKQKTSQNSNTKERVSTEGIKTTEGNDTGYIARNSEVYSHNEFREGTEYSMHHVSHGVKGVKVKDVSPTPTKEHSNKSEEKICEVLSPTFLYDVNRCNRPVCVWLSHSVCDHFISAKKVLHKDCSVDEYLKTVSEIMHTQKANWQGARIQVSSDLNLNMWEQLLGNYHDKHVVNLLRFGFPLGIVDYSNLNRKFIKNHSSAEEFPGEVDKYISKELYWALLRIYHI